MKKKSTTKPVPRIKKSIPVGPVPELDALHVRYHMEYGKGREQYVQTIRIPWNGKQWMSVLNKEGPWLPMCCGNISAIRDHLISTLREDGWLDMSGLSEVIELLNSHDGFDDWFKKGFKPTDDVLRDPMYKLVQIWDAVKDRRAVTWKDEPHVAKDAPADELEHTLRGYNILRIFHAGHYDDPEEQKRHEYEHDQLRVLALGKVFGPLMALHREFTEKYLSMVVPGFAVVHKDHPDKPMETRGGPAIYGTMQEAEEVIGWWVKDQRNNGHDDKMVREEFIIRPCRMTVEKGVEFQSPT